MKKEELFNVCLEVASADYNWGVLFAIEVLEKYNFDCSYYWDTMKNIPKDLDTDEINLETRDKLYKKLGIYSLMQKAYKKIWY